MLTTMAFPWLLFTPAREDGGPRPMAKLAPPKLLFTPAREDGGSSKIFKAAIAFASIHPRRRGGSRMACFYSPPPARTGAIQAYGTRPSAELLFTPAREDGGCRICHSLLRKLASIHPRPRGRGHRRKVSPQLSVASIHPRPRGRGPIHQPCL